MKHRRGALFLSAVVSAALIAPASVGSAPALGCAAPGPQRTLEVTVKSLTKVVKRKNIAKIEVRTYRPAQENLADTGLNLPPGTPMEPAGNIPITVGVLTGGGYVYQNVANQTDSEGVRVVKMRLESYHKPGSAELRARAFIDHSPNTSGQCVEIQEYGYTEQKNAFLVR